MADPYQAGQTLGEAIFGDQQATYQGELRKAAQGADALEQARRNRALALIAQTQQEQISGITPELLERVTLGDPAADAELQARSLIGKLNLRNLGEREQPHYSEAQNIRFEGLLGDTPDIGRANKATAFVEGKPYEPVRVLGGAYVPEAATLGEEFTMIPTPATAAQIEATERRADAAVQRSLRAPAPRSPRAPTAASAENDILAQARAAIANGASKEAVQKRLRDKGYSKLAGRL